MRAFLVIWFLLHAVSAQLRDPLIDLLATQNSYDAPYQYDSMPIGVAVGPPLLDQQLFVGQPMIPRPQFATPAVSLTPHASYLPQTVAYSPNPIAYASPAVSYASPISYATPVSYADPSGLYGAQPLVPIKMLLDEDKDDMNDGAQDQQQDQVARRSGNNNVQSGIQQFGEGNTNLQGNIQQIGRRSAAQQQGQIARRSGNSNVQSGIQQVGMGNTNLQGNIQQIGRRAAQMQGYGIGQTQAFSRDQPNYKFISPNRKQLDQQNLLDEIQSLSDVLDVPLVPVADVNDVANINDFADAPNSALRGIFGGRRFPPFPLPTTTIG